MLELFGRITTVMIKKSLNDQNIPICSHFLFSRIPFYSPPPGKEWRRGRSTGQAGNEGGESKGTRKKGENKKQRGITLIITIVMKGLNNSHIKLVVFLSFAQYIDGPKSKFVPYFYPVPFLLTHASICMGCRVIMQLLFDMLRGTKRVLRHVTVSST